MPKFSRVRNFLFTALAAGLLILALHCPPADPVVAPAHVHASKKPGECWYCDYVDKVGRGATPEQAEKWYWEAKAKAKAQGKLGDHDAR